MAQARQSDKENRVKTQKSNSFPQFPTISRVPFWAKGKLFCATLSKSSSDASADGAKIVRHAASLEQTKPDWSSGSTDGARPWEFSPRAACPESYLSLRPSSGHGWATGGVFLGRLIRSIHRWLTVQWVCCWCDEPHRLGGNPWASRISHGCCAKGEENLFKHL